MKNSDLTQHHPLMKSIAVFLLCAALLLGLTACADAEGSAVSSRTPEEGSLFSYALTVENEVFSPRDAVFGMTPSQVLEIKNISSDSVNSEAYSGNGPVIEHTISVDGISDSITERFVFDQDALVEIQYAFYVPSSQTSEMCTTLSSDAAKHMPAGQCRSEDTVFSLQNTSLVWDDPFTNRVSLAFGTDSEGNTSSFSLQVSMGTGTKRPLGENLFAETVDLGTDNSLNPHGVSFGMSLEGVTDALGNHNALHVRTSDSNAETQFLNTVCVSGIIYPFRQVMSFQNDKLTSVSYTACVPETKLEDLCAVLREQADVVMPQALISQSDDGQPMPAGTTWEGTNHVCVSVEEESSGVKGMTSLVLLIRPAA